jgi:uncharacterized membrane protein
VIILSTRSAATAVIRTAPARPRIHTMDELRGFAVLCMVFYHAFYTMAFLFNIPLGRTLLLFFEPAEPYFAGLFIVISGISSQLSHSNLVRGVKLFAVALVISAATLLVVPQEGIRFGILHFLAVCMILFGLLQPFFKRIPLLLGLACAALLCVLTWNLGEGFFGFPGGWKVPVPGPPYGLQFFYPNPALRGIPYSADYFPLLPWIFVFLGGTFLGRYAAKGLFPKMMYVRRVPALSFLGRHALAVYVLHQPLIYAAVWGVTELVRLFPG